MDDTSFHKRRRCPSIDVDQDGHSGFFRSDARGEPNLRVLFATRLRAVSDGKKGIAALPACVVSFLWKRCETGRTFLGQNVHWVSPKPLEIKVLIKGTIAKQCFWVAYLMPMPVLGILCRERFQRQDLHPPAFGGIESGDLRLAKFFFDLGSFVEGVFKNWCRDQKGRPKDHVFVWLLL